MYKRILVPTDGSALSRKAIRSAIGLASTAGAEVVAVNVVPRYPVSYLEGAIGVSQQETAHVEKEWAVKGQAVADEVGKAAEKAGVKARAITVRSNFVAEAILAAARKNKCDLVVMASHGRKGIKRLLLGSETQVLHVQAPVPPRVKTMAGAAAVNDYSSDEVTKVLAPIQEFLKRHEVPFRTTWTIGPPAAEIIEAAQREKAHMIVMGTQERGLLGRALMCSVAQNVLPQAEVPVLLVK